jgi:hypothetical protein
MVSVNIIYAVGRKDCSVYHERRNGVQAGIYYHGHYSNQISAIRKLSLV